MWAWGVLCASGELRWRGVDIGWDVQLGVGLKTGPVSRDSAGDQEPTVMGTCGSGEPCIRFIKKCI